MFISKTKTKNSVIYYLSKSYIQYDTHKHTTKIVEKLGTEEDIRKNFKVKGDLKKWLKDYAKKRTEEDNKENKKHFNFKSDDKSDYKLDDIKNIGYLFYQKICYEIGLNTILDDIAKKEKLDFDFTTIILHVIYNNLTNNTEIQDELSNIKTFIDPCDIDFVDMKRAVYILQKYNVYIQKRLFNKVDKLFETDSKKVFYSCDNLSLLIRNLLTNKNFKDVPNLIYIIKCFYDENGLLRAYTLETNEDQNLETNNKIVKYLTDHFKGASLYAIPKSIASPTDDKTFSKFDRARAITTYQLSDKDIDWLYNFEDWKSLKDSDTKDVEKLFTSIVQGSFTMQEFYTHYGDIYYKSKDYKNKTLTAFLSFEYMKWLNDIAGYQIITFKDTIEPKIKTYNELQLEKFTDSKNNILRNVSVDSEEGEKLDYYYFDDATMQEKRDIFNGFIAIHDTIDEETLNQVMNIWQLKNMQYDYEISFANMDILNNDLLNPEETVNAHLLISYLALTVLKVLENKLDNKFWCRRITEKIQEMNVLKIDKDLSVPLFTVSDLTDALCDTLKIDADFKFFDDQKIRNIIKQSRRK
ncbi:MAG: hypothetical protein Q4E88_03630 [Coriobacteriia bacterium]|nr:hypothetical protein [Coriobacteriia bacterium]